MSQQSNSNWFSPHTCVFEDDAIRLLKFSDGKGSLLIAPPQAGHHSYIADYHDQQSLVQCAVENGGYSVYAIEWKDCTWMRAGEGVEDLLAQLGTCVDMIGEEIHLVGLCQGGWLSTIYTALHPGRIASLTIAGAPIDTHRGDTALNKFVKMPLYAFQGLVFMGGGLMRGHMMLSGWKSSNPYQHFVERYQNSDEKTERFYRWYDKTQDLAGAWYLWAIDKLFKRNLLGTNQLEIAGQHVDLTRIACPVHVVTGERDDITPAEQSLALLEYSTGKTSTHSIDAGHIGVFMSARGIRDTWTPFFQSL